MAEDMREPRLVAMSIQRTEAQKCSQLMDDHCPRPPEWMYDLSSPQSRRTAVEVSNV